MNLGVARLQHKPSPKIDHKNQKILFIFAFIDDVGKI